MRIGLALGFWLLVSASVGSTGLAGLGARRPFIIIAASVPGGAGERSFGRCAHFRPPGRQRL